MNRFVLRRIVHLDACARRLEEQDLHDEAVSLREEVCELVGDHLGGDHPWRISRLLELAASCRRCGATQRSEALYRDVIRRLSARLGKEDPDGNGAHRRDLARALNALGVLYCETGRHRPAIRWFERALAISRDQLSAEDPGLAAILHNLGSAHHALDRHRQAEACYLEALATYESQGEARLPEQAQVLHDLAELAADQGDLDDSAARADRAGTLYRTFEQAGDSNLAEPLIRLAHLYRRIDRPERAAALYEEATEMLQRAGPAHDHDLAYCLDQLSELHRVGNGRA